MRRLGVGGVEHPREHVAVQPAQLARGEVRRAARHEHGLIDEADFREFVFTNPIRFYTRANPRFFEGTRVEAAAANSAACVEALLGLLAEG